jgi:glycosyltransferase involved in cell wall biosynthesis
MKAGPYSRPTVSVVIPSYNRAHLIGRAIQSVLHQTFESFEIIVVDDASCDDTRGVVQKIDDNRVRYIRHEVNEGVSAARNTAIKAARGQFIGFLDSDDEWLPIKLQRQVAKFNDTPENTGLVYGSCLFVNDETKEVVGMVAARHRGRVLHEILLRDFVASPTPLAKRECFDKAGLFAVDFQTSEDWDMWLRIAQHYEFDFVEDLVAKHYVSSYQTTSRVEPVVEGYLKFLAKHETLISKDHRLLAHHFKIIGYLYTVHHRYSAARSYFAKAVRLNPRSVLLYIHLLAACTVPRLYVRIGMWTKMSLERIRYRRNM